MTDPGFADRTYLEPLDLEGVADVLERERPDALLPTMGGQTALNLVDASSPRRACSTTLGVELIGAGRRRDQARRGPRALPRGRAERRAAACRARGSSPRSTTSPASPLPAVVRPAFTLGGHGGGFVSTTGRARAPGRARPAREPDRPGAGRGVGARLGRVRARGRCATSATTSSIVCSIENLDPMGVHTGDSVTVAPQMTLSDEAYQELRDAAAAVIRAVGVETGGSNIQFARERETGELRVIEMNPRVSRSSALASKATGYPIAKVAAKLAVGYTLDEIPNDLTKTTPASFEPTLDYVVVKFPRFAFEKFPGADRTLGTQMKSVGEAMGIGRTFREAFWKAFALARARRGRGHAVGRRSTTCPRASTRGSGASWSGCATRARRRASASTGASTPAPARSRPSRTTTTRPSARPTRRRRDRRRAARRDHRLRPEPDRPGDRVRLLLRPRRAELPGARLRGGDGQLQPGDGLDRLRHLRPPLLRAARRRGGARRLRARAAGGRRDPVRRPDAAEARAGDRGRPASGSSGTPYDGDRPRRGPRALRRAARRARDPLPGVGDRRERPRGGARSPHRIGYPVLVRPSYVLGGRAMRVCYRGSEVRRGVRTATSAARCSSTASSRTRSRSTSTRSATARRRTSRAVMQHVEEAGVHSGDSACVLPAPSLDGATAREVEARRPAARARARRRSA